MPMQFDYDEIGDMFTYFMISFGALILTPVTIYKWSSGAVSKEQSRLNKLRDRHGKSKWFTKKEAKLKTENATPWVRRGLIVLAWAAIAQFGYSASLKHTEVKVEFDPFVIMGIEDRKDELSDWEASKKVIKKIYRELSRTKHPDKLCGVWIQEHDGEACPEEQRKEYDDAWALIVKAHETLTDETSWRNWLETGNPDGRLQTTWGIALPAWLVAEENHLYVLGVYGLIFGIMLPAAVGSWWYRSIQYTGDSVLIKTTKMFEYYLYKTPLMNRRRALMVFSGAFEFKRDNNKEIKERENDEVELPKLAKAVEEHERNISKPPTDQPFAMPYSMKVRLLYFAHLYNIPLSPELEEDLAVILQKIPLLHGELISKTFIMTQVMLQGGHFQRIPKVETLDNIIKNMQNLVQGIGLNQRSAPFMQLPHFREEFIKHLNAKKARSLRQLATKPPSEIRDIFRNLNDDEFSELEDVFRNMPALDMDVKVRVEDDSEEEKITAGSIVTITTTLTRRTIGDIIDAADRGEELTINDGEMGEIKIAVKKEVGEAPKTQTSKPKSKKGPEAAAERRRRKAEREAAQKDGGDAADGDSSEEASETTELVPAERDEEVSSDEEGDEEQYWKKVQKKVQKKKAVLTRDNSKMTHTVFADRFPAEKQEWWWAYLVMVNPKREKTSERLMVDPVNITNLAEEEEIDMRFQAPGKPGMYNFTIYVRSDSYIELDVRHQFSIQVHEKPPEIDIEEYMDDDDEDPEDDGFITDSEAEPEVSSEEESSEEESD